MHTSLPAIPLPQPSPSELDAVPVGWYVHLPFCHSKCGYCDFYSLPTQPEWVDALVAAICREIELRRVDRPVATAFVGGGTPTVLPPAALRTVLLAVPPPVAEGEFTVEANPSSADELKLELLRECGVNRVSFGAQSFFADELAVLERLHAPAHIPEAVRFARQAGFDNINLDLIFGVPGQTVARWEESLRRAVDLGAEHLSCYSLMYEEGTSLTKQHRIGRIQAIDEEIELEMFERTIDLLAAAGYRQYEISNFARPGRECRHNLIYWRNEDYVGIGPSAVSCEYGLRTKNVADVRRYSTAVLGADAIPRFADGGLLSLLTTELPPSRVPNNIQILRPILPEIVVESERLEVDAALCETAIQMLRMTEGIDIPRFRRRYGVDPLIRFAEAIGRFTRSGHLIADAQSIRFTRRGLAVSNAVMRDFLGAAAPVAAGVPA